MGEESFGVGQVMKSTTEGCRGGAQRPGKVAVLE
jgi:hypothetical protein